MFFVHKYIRRRYRHCEINCEANRLASMHSKKTKIICAILTLLIVLVIVVTWYLHRTHRTPLCDNYSGASQTMCTTAKTGCNSLSGSDKTACLNATAWCMPVLDVYKKANGTQSQAEVLHAVAPHLKGCALAVSRVSPSLSANIITKNMGGSACLSPTTASVMTSSTFGDDMQHVLSAAKPLTKWAVKTGQLLPVCKH